MDVHPSARHWALPPAARPALPPPLERTNLRALAAREGRLEHHLVVVARTGDAQLELVTASEPLFFAHDNVSDEHVLALGSGDPLLDAMPIRTFLSDPASGEDVARLLSRAHDLVLHPFGWSHWPGRLRPPFEPPHAPPGVGRRAGLSVVLCAARPTAPSGPPPRVSAHRADDAKAYVEEGPPLGLIELASAGDGALAAIDDVTLSLAPPPFAPPAGGWVLLLDGDTPGAFAGDLVRVPRGARFDPDVARALVIASPTREPSPPPAVWQRVPERPFDPPVARGPRATIGALSLAVVSPTEVEARLGERSARVPRYWLARMLYRIALHTALDDGLRVAPRPCFGRVETYGGLYYDDRDGAFRFGLRGGASVTVSAGALVDELAAAYAAVAPQGHTEDLR
ncbi:MAG: hypothetical protein KF729_10685 [Sandaracinaceae bacterium]|nr:hypothetical protein [Sandaracinaceae bacterium]